MTPREPDRFEEKAKAIVDATIDRMNGKMDHAECVSVEDHIAAALRAEHDDALERFRSAFDTAWHGGCVSWACECDEPKEEGNCARLRAVLASPAAAPAAETCWKCTAPIRNPRVCDYCQADLIVPPSEPAPLLPRVLRALETWGFAALAAELRAYIAELEPAEKRIAELEAALRDALNAAHHHVQAGQHWICSEPFACEEECPCAKLAACAATKGEGT